jgi:hypothetical protein
MERNLLTWYIRETMDILNPKATKPAIRASPEY